MHTTPMHKPHTPHTTTVNVKYVEPGYAEVALDLVDAFGVVTIVPATNTGPRAPLYASGDACATIVVDGEDHAFVRFPVTVSADVIAREFADLGFDLPSLDPTRFVFAIAAAATA